VGKERPAPDAEKPYTLLPLQPLRRRKNPLCRRGSPALVRGKPQPPQTRRQRLAGRPTPPSQTQPRAQPRAPPQLPIGHHPLRGRPAFGTLLRTLPSPPAPRPSTYPQGQSRSMSLPTKRPACTTVRDSAPLPL